MKSAKVLPLIAVVFSATLLSAGGSRNAAAGPAAGKLNVKILEWDVPTAKARPHDPAVGRDGALWFTEQLANKLGRLDPQPTRDSTFSPEDAELGTPRPCGGSRRKYLVPAPNYAGLIGKLDPRTITCDRI